MTAHWEAHPQGGWMLVQEGSPAATCIGDVAGWDGSYEARAFGLPGKREGFSIILPTVALAKAWVEDKHGLQISSRLAMGERK